MWRYGPGDYFQMPQTITRRFYKSHSGIQRPQILKLKSEAIAEATAEINKGTKDEYYIVEIVAVVRKQQPISTPIEVIEVKG